MASSNTDLTLRVGPRLGPQVWETKSASSFASALCGEILLTFSEYQQRNPECLPPQALRSSLAMLSQMELELATGRDIKLSDLKDIAAAMLLVGSVDGVVVASREANNEIEMLLPEIKAEAAKEVRSSTGRKAREEQYETKWGPSRRAVKNITRQILSANWHTTKKHIVDEAMNSLIEEGLRYPDLPVVGNWVSAEAKLMNKQFKGGRPKAS